MQVSKTKSIHNRSNINKNIIIENDIFQIKNLNYTAINKNLDRKCEKKFRIQITLISKDYQILQSFHHT